MSGHSIGDAGSSRNVYSFDGSNPGIGTHIDEEEAAIYFLSFFKRRKKERKKERKKKKKEKEKERKKHESSFFPLLICFEKLIYVQNSDPECTDHGSTEISERWEKSG
ncbi:MAG: hypothetical protein Q8P67_13415 [archaeon]|nr:hypothetical protein [archaeon]